MDLVLRGAMMNIETELDALLVCEGGYVNHSADRGGETNWGITKAVAREAGYLGEMKALTRETAKEIYRKNYWTGPKFDKVAALSVPVALELFDTGVNMGPVVAGQFLQRVLNVFVGGLVVDGKIGPSSLNALQAFLLKRGAGGQKNMLKALNNLQGEKYISIVERNASQCAFVYGWFDGRVDLRRA